jgi:hypothetical protein
MYRCYLLTKAALTRVGLILACKILFLMVMFKLKITDLRLPNHTRDKPCRLRGNLPPNLHQDVADIVNSPCSFYNK